MSEQVLSMAPAPLPRPPAREAVRRSRALVVLAGLALLMHALLLGEVQWTWPDAAPRLPALEVRTIGAAAATPGPTPMRARATPDSAAPAPMRAEVGDANLVESAPHDTRGRPREAAPKPTAVRTAPPTIDAARSGPRPADAVRRAPPAQGRSALAATAPETTLPKDEAAASARPRPQRSAANESAPSIAVESAPSIALEPAPSIAIEPAPSIASESAWSDDASIALYRTRIPPPATLHYALRRGASRGSAEMQWRPTAEGYALRLDASIAGATVLSQTSEGSFDAAGLAPLRYTDRRQRRQLLATNFQREAGKISFSGSSNEFALRRGAQDRLAWMLQLAAIAAGEPERLVPGGVIEIAVAGVRGDAAIWSFRCAGVEPVDTGAEALPAVKLVRRSAGPYDTTVEVWLDPQRDYFPLRVLLRSANDAQTLELALQRLEPGR